MDTYHLPTARSVFGMPVETFPQGIGEAFHDLMQRIPDGKHRGYYGLSHMDASGKIFYFVSAEEKFSGEAEKYGLTRYTIDAGDYLSVTVQNWRDNTDCIKDVFRNMMQDPLADCTKPCVEWYKTDDEMLCLLQANPVKLLLAAIAEKAAELLSLLMPLSEAQVNTVPFKGSWTAAQMARHVCKSNNAMAQAMEMEGKSAARDIAAKAGELKETFLNYSIKFNSPSFIVPEEKAYKKDVLLASLKKSNEVLTANAAKADVAVMIDLPAAFGEITKLELLHFVVYHTERHIHQLKNILKHL